MPTSFVVFITGLLLCCNKQILLRNPFINLGDIFCPSLIILDHRTTECRLHCENIADYLAKYY